MRPTYGDIVSLDSTKLVKIDEDTQHSFRYTGNTVVAPGGVRCATFVGDDGTVYMQPWSMTARFRRRGEKNIGAFLKNEQVIEMVKLFVSGKEKIPALAAKYQITEDHCRDIVNGKSWRHITVGLIRQLRFGGGDMGTVVRNRPASRRKLSPSIVPFIRKDATVNRMKVRI